MVKTRTTELCKEFIIQEMTVVYTHEGLSFVQGTLRRGDTVRPFGHELSYSEKSEFAEIILRGLPANLSV